MRWALGLTALLSACDLVTQSGECPAYECPEVPDEPAVDQYAVAIRPEGSTKEPRDGVLDVDVDQAVLEYTDAQGNTWQVTWAY